MEALVDQCRAIEYNNIGLSCWHSGDGFRAIEFLFTSYRHCVKSLMVGVTSGDGNNQVGLGIDDFIASSLQINFERQDSRRTVFHNGVKIPSALKKRNTYSTRSVVLQAVVFNLAMVHHLIAEWNKTTTVDCDHNLRRTLRARAIEFYQKGLRLRDKEGSEMYKIAILNNLGHLYFSMGDEERSLPCFSQMLSRMSLLEEQEQRDGVAIFVKVFSESASRILCLDNAAAAA